MAHGKRFRFFLAGAALGILPAAARADVPPPDDYVETCTREKQEKPDEYCEYRAGGYWDVYGCLNGRDDKAPQCGEGGKPPEELDCCDDVVAAGWAYRCKKYGASSFQTLWCRARKAGDPEPPPPDTRGETDSGGAPGTDSGAASGSGSNGGTTCAARTGGAGAATGLLLLLFGLVFVWRRARDRA